MAIVDRSSGSFEAQIVATQISTWSSRGSRYFRGRGRADKIEALREDLELTVDWSEEDCKTTESTNKR